MGGRGASSPIITKGTGKDKKQLVVLGRYGWKPNKAAAAEFKETMAEVDKFVRENNIGHSLSMDSFYFNINGQEYRVSNHSIEASNKGAYDSDGNKKRDLYHKATREKDVKYIHASKTRIIDIYKDLKAGYELDGRGNRKK